MYAVVRPSPPQQMFVVNGSPPSVSSIVEPSGEIEVTPPPVVMIVATHTLPSASTPSESNSCSPGRPATRGPPCSTSPGSGSTSPGPVTFHDHSRPVHVSATYTVPPSGESPMPLGDCRPQMTSRISDPSAFA